MIREQHRASLSPLPYRLLSPGALTSPNPFSPMKNGREGESRSVVNALSRWRERDEVRAYRF